VGERGLQGEFRTEPFGCRNDLTEVLFLFSDIRVRERSCWKKTSEFVPDEGDELGSHDQS